MSDGNTQNFLLGIMQILANLIIRFKNLRCCKNLSGLIKLISRIYFTPSCGPLAMASWNP